MKANEFDKRFDDGSDISKYLDMSKARRDKDGKPCPGATTMGVFLEAGWSGQL